MENTNTRLIEDNKKLLSSANCSECKLHNAFRRMDENELKNFVPDYLPADTEESEEEEPESDLEETRPMKRYKKESQELLAGGILCDMFTSGESHKKAAHLIHIPPVPGDYRVSTRNQKKKSNFKAKTVSPKVSRAIPKETNASSDPNRRVSVRIRDNKTKPVTGVKRKADEEPEKEESEKESESGSDSGSGSGSGSGSETYVHSFLSKFFIVIRVLAQQKMKEPIWSKEVMKN